MRPDLEAGAETAEGGRPLCETFNAAIPSLPAMPTGFPFSKCPGCGKEIRDRAELSDRGLCGDCGPRRQREATMQLVNHAGPVFEHWRRRCAAAVGAVLLDDAPDAP